MNTRIIAKLDVKPPFIVKTSSFRRTEKMGIPSELARKYYNQGADELFYIDIVSSLYQRNILSDGIGEAANVLFIPFAIGGGIRSVDYFSKFKYIE